MLTKRIISSAILISIISTAIFFDWLCSLVIILFIIGGLYEYFLMLEKKGIKIYKYFGVCHISVDSCCSPFVFVGHIFAGLGRSAETNILLAKLLIDIASNFDDRFGTDAR